MKKLLMTLMVALPIFAHAQKIDEQKLKTQLKTLAKSGQKKFTDLHGKIKSIERADTTYYSKFKLAYTIDTSNVIVAGYYNVVFDTEHYPGIMDIVDKLISTSDFGYGKMQPGGGRTGLYLYSATGKKVGNVTQFISMTVDMDRGTLSVHGAW